MRNFLSRKKQESVVFVKEEFLHKKIQKKEDVFGYFWTQTHSHLGRQCEKVCSMEACEGYKVIGKFDKVYS